MLGELSMMHHEESQPRHCLPGRRVGVNHHILIPRILSCLLIYLHPRNYMDLCTSKSHNR